MDKIGMPIRLKIPIRYTQTVVTKYRFVTRHDGKMVASDWTLDQRLLDWVAEHAPTARIDYSEGQPVITFNDEREAFEFKVRWY
jgi:hypothetical protein